VLALEGQEHLPGDAAIAEVTGRPGTELDDVLASAKSILKSDRTRWRAEAGKELTGRLRGRAGGDLAAGGVGGFDGGEEIGAAVSFNQDVYIAILVLGAEVAGGGIS